MKICVKTAWAIFCLSMASCGTMRSVGTGSKWVYDKTGQGVSTATHAVVDSTRRLVTWDWGKKNSAPKTAVAPQSAPPPSSSTPAPVKAEDKLFQFPDRNLLVTDSMMGQLREVSPDGRELISNSWTVAASKIFFASDVIGGQPKMMRAEGSPARAETQMDGDPVVGEANEIHWQEKTGILVLKGSPVFQVGSKRVVGGERSSIKLHLPTNAMSADGSVRTEQVSR